MATEARKIFRRRLITRSPTIKSRLTQLPLFNPEVMIFILIGGTALLGYVGVGGILRITFPAFSCMLGAYFLYNKKNEYFLQLALWLFMITPFIRRLVDYHAGYVAANALMLAPYVVIGLVIPITLIRLTHVPHFRCQAGFGFILAAIFYGLCNALFNGRWFAGLYDALTWLGPVSVGLFITLDWVHRESYKSIVVKTILYAVPLMGGYAVYQFANPPPWDGYWLQNAGMGSIGIAAPFMIRVFSTMNSPGPFAQDVVFCLLFLLGAGGSRYLRTAAFVLGGAAVLLSTVRTAWLGFGSGAFALIGLGGASRMKSSVFMAACSIVVGLTILMQIPQTEELISERFASFSSMDKDVSYGDRLYAYGTFFSVNLGNAPFGHGFGSTGVRAEYVDSGAENIIDGAIIEVGNILGIFFGPLYITGVLMIVCNVVLARAQRTDAFMNASAAVVVAGAAMLTGGNTVVGECGIFFWIAVGFCLSETAAYDNSNRRIY